MKNKPPVFQNPQSEGGSFFWEGKPQNSIGILLLHGFTATTVEVRPMAKFLLDEGYSVAGILLPGHGVSPEELNQAKYLDWINAAENAFLDLAGKFKKVIVIGESMGGLLSLWLAANHPKITGILLFAPALKIPRLWQSNLVCPFVKFIYKKNIDLTSSWQGFNVVPLQAASQLHLLQQKIRHILPKVFQPLIVFQGKLDTTIDPIGSIDILEAVSSSEKEMIWLEESAHCILLDKQMDLVNKLSLEFISSHIE